MAFNILKFFQPRDKIFHTLFEQNAEIAVQISEKFLEAMKSTGKQRFRILAENGHLEHRADQVAHEIYVQLSKNFITPFDREDIHALAAAMDDVVDYIDEIGHKMENYGFKEQNGFVLKMAEYNYESTKELLTAIQGLRNKKNLMEVNKACLSIHGYESKADVVFNDAMADLIKNYKDDPVHIIVMKDLYEELELISDKCQDVSNIIESIVIKYS
jgi:predicted phosphate transport protein (TIGR00153 family)